MDQNGDKAFERRSSRFATYLDHHTAIVEPLAQRRNMYEEAAIQFAQSALRMGLFLNGGAAVAVPTYLQAIGSPVPTYTLVGAIAAFAIGMVFAFAGHLAAYRATTRAAMAVSEQMIVEGSGVTESYFGPQSTAFNEAARRAAYAQGQIYLRAATVGRVVGFWCAALSLIAFSIGAGMGLCSFDGAMQP